MSWWDQDYNVGGMEDYSSFDGYASPTSFESMDWSVPTWQPDPAISADVDGSYWDSFSTDANSWMPEYEMPFQQQQSAPQGQQEEDSWLGKVGSATKDFLGSPIGQDVTRGALGLLSRYLLGDFDDPRNVPALLQGPVDMGGPMGPAEKPPGAAEKTTSALAKFPVRY